MLMFCGVIFAILSGISQPLLALIAGQLTNILLTVQPTSAEFKVRAYQKVFLFLGIGCFLLVINYLQVKRYFFFSK